MSGGLRPWCRGDLKERLREHLAGPWLQAARGLLGQAWSSPQPSSLRPSFRLFWKQPPGLCLCLHYESSSALSRRIPSLPRSLSLDARLQPYGVMSEASPRPFPAHQTLPLGVGLSWASPKCLLCHPSAKGPQFPPSPCASVYYSVHQESNRGASPSLNLDSTQLCASDRALEGTLCTQEGTVRVAWLGHFQEI